MRCLVCRFLQMIETYFLLVERKRGSIHLPLVGVLLTGLRLESFYWYSYRGQLRRFALIGMILLCYIFFKVFKMMPFFQNGQRIGNDIHVSRNSNMEDPQYIILYFIMFKYVYLIILVCFRFAEYFMMWWNPWCKKI